MSGDAVYGAHFQGASRLRSRISQFLRSNGAANKAIRRELVRVKDEGITCYAFGGFARGVYLSGAETIVKDIDLVFDESNYERFTACFAASIKKINRFGGANLQLGGVDVDAWSLENTWAFRHGYFDQPSFVTLPRTTYLSADAIVVQLWPDTGRPRKVFAKGFFETFERGLLDVNFDPNPFPELTVVRTLVAAKRNCFSLAPALARSTKDILVRHGLERIYAAQRDHYKKEYLSYDELQDIFLRLVRHVNNRPNCVFVHFRDAHQSMLPLSYEAIEAGASQSMATVGIQLDLF